MQDNAITISATINAPLDKVWNYWTSPEHIMQWNNASEDWHTPHAENDPRTGGKFLSRMAAKDGSFSFDFAGEYTHVEEQKSLEYKLGDEREVKVLFEGDGNTTTVTETFDPEGMNPIDMQRAGWQAILDSFKRHTENN